ncbi:hypothetical protein pb186bvf_010837 [Paramecium bursaria]
MLTITQSRLANVIQAIAQSELLSEKRKSILGELHHFQVEAAFNRLDQSRVGKLASSDLNEFLDDNRIPHSQVEAAYLFKKIDNDRDGRISVGDFSKFIVAKSTRNIVLGRQPYNVEVGMLLPAEVEQALADVFAQELSNYRNINIPRTALINSLDYNALEAFRLLDLFNQGYINIDSLALFMKNQGIILLRDELDAFFQAVDLDQDGKISYSELVEAVHLMEPLPYKPDVPLRSELLNAIENSRSLERIYLSQYPYYFYPYYPYYYPYYYPSLKLESTRERERSLERLHRSRIQQINTESRLRDLENERRRSEERQRSAERLRQIQEESFLRKSQIEEANRIRELDRIQNEELRRSREIIRQAETEARLRQLEIDQQALQIERESRFKALERESRLRQAERELVDSQIRANFERLSSIERLKQLEDLRRLEADKLRTSQELAYRPYVYNTYQPYYNSAIQKYPYSIIDSVNAFNTIRKYSPTKSLVQSTIYESPSKITKKQEFRQK